MWRLVRLLPEPCPPPEDVRVVRRPEIRNLPLRGRGGGWDARAIRRPALAAPSILYISLKPVR